MQKRATIYFVWCLAVLAGFSVPLLRLLRLALRHGYSSHIVFVPAISIYLIWSARKTIFQSTEYAFSRGVQIALGALVAMLIAFVRPFSQALGAADFLIVLSVLLFIVAGFIGFFGAGATRRALFPLGMLVFMLPVPSMILQKIVFFLQSQSAELTYWAFTVLHVPVLRNGFVFSLPGVIIEVAAECSGINSSIALLILMIVIAHESLSSNWHRFILVILVIPFSIVKNAIRIVTLTMLSIKVDPGFLTGRLHHEGGFFFFLITLGLLFPIWTILHKRESRNSYALTKSAESSYVPADR